MSEITSGDDDDDHREDQSDQQDPAATDAAANLEQEPAADEAASDAAADDDSEVAATPPKAAAKPEATADDDSKDADKDTSAADAAAREQAAQDKQDKDAAAERAQAEQAKQDTADADRTQAARDQAAEEAEAEQDQTDREAAARAAVDAAHREAGEEAADNHPAEEERGDQGGRDRTDRAGEGDKGEKLAAEVGEAAKPGEDEADAEPAEAEPEQGQAAAGDQPAVGDAKEGNRDRAAHGAGRQAVAHTAGEPGEAEPAGEHDGADDEAQPRTDEQEAGGEEQESEDERPELALRGNEIEVAGARSNVSALQSDIMRVLMDAAGRPMTAAEVATALTAASGESGTSSRSIGQATSYLAGFLAQAAGSEVITVNQPSSKKNPVTYQLNPAYRYAEYTDNGGYEDVSEKYDRITAVPAAISADRPDAVHRFEIIDDHTIRDSAGNTVRLTHNGLYIFNTVTEHPEPQSIDDIRSQGFETSDADPARRCRASMRDLRGRLSQLEGGEEIIQRQETEEGVRFSVGPTVTVVDRRAEIAAEREAAEASAAQEAVQREEAERIAAEQRAAEMEELTATYDRVATTARSAEADHPKQGGTLDRAVAEATGVDLETARDMVAIDRVARTLDVPINPSAMPEVERPQDFVPAALTRIDEAIRSADLTPLERLVFGLRLGLPPTMDSYARMQVTRGGSDPTPYSTYYQWTQSDEHGRDEDSLRTLFRRADTETIQRTFNRAVTKVRSRLARNE